jgi:hypothetical protein
LIYLEQGYSVSSSAKAKLCSSISGNSFSVFVNLLDFITDLNQTSVLNVFNFVTERGVEFGGRGVNQLLVSKMGTTGLGHGHGNNMVRNTYLS